MRLNLEHKVALVTGGAKGIGRAVATAFVEEGTTVIIGDIDTEEAENVAKTLSETGSTCIARSLDVADRPQVRAVAEDALNLFGRVDILVNNAGMATVAGIEELTDEVWDQVMNVNVKGTFYCCQALLPVMKSHRSGSIVNLASAVVKTGGYTPYAHYVASKSAIWGFTMHLARHMAPHGIRVNAVAPGTTDTHFVNNMMPPDIRAKTDETIPLGRIAAPEDIASAIVFLASDAARYITGELLDVNGGTVMD